jgi:hypothetical protein
VYTHYLDVVSTTDDSVLGWQNYTDNPTGALVGGASQDVLDLCDRISNIAKK